MTTEKQNIEHIIKVAINMVFIKSMNFAKGRGGFGSIKLVELRHFLLKCMYQASA
jgi:hypothetical protein